MKFLSIILFLLTSSIARTQCQANIEYSTGDNGIVTFTNLSTGINDSIYISWSYGDGTFEYNITDPIHTFEFNSTYTIYYFMYNPYLLDSAMSSCDTTFTVTITNTTPIECESNFVYTFGENGQVLFTSTSNISGDYPTYFWNFDDGYYGFGSETEHSYLNDGVYTVNLEIYSDYCIANIEYTIEVTNATPCVASFYYLEEEQGSISFYSTSTDTESSTSFNWNFGDLTVGNGESVMHTYLYNNFYDISLHIYDSLLGCNSYASQTIYIDNIFCNAVADFSLQKDSLTEFNWFAYPNYPSNISSASWSWGDGSASEGLYPSHTYSEAGLYTICLIIIVDCDSTTSSDTTCITTDIFRLGGESNEYDIISINVVDNSTIIADVNKEKTDLKIYPNPNNGVFYFELSEETNQSKYADVVIRNLLGQIAYSSKIIVTNGRAQMNLNDLPKGTYFLNASTKNSINISKMIVY